MAGMSVSTLGEVLSSETLWASDDLAARVDELQFDLGEGPCWDAANARTPVLETDLKGHGRHRWPAFSAAADSTRIRSLHAFPLIFGPLTLGAIDLYGLTTGLLTPSQVEDMQDLATALARLVLREALVISSEDPDTPTTHPHSRRVVHQAIGAVVFQLGLTPTDAELVIQGRAYADDRSMLEVAEDIMNGRVVFTIKDNGNEDTR